MKTYIPCTQNLSYARKAIRDRCPADHTQKLPCPICGETVDSPEHKWRWVRPLKDQTILKRLREVQDLETLANTTHRVATEGYTKLLQELISVCPHTDTLKSENGGHLCQICQTHIPPATAQDVPKVVEVGL